MSERRFFTINLPISRKGYVHERILCCEFEKGKSISGTEHYVIYLLLRPLWPKYVHDKIELGGALS